MRIMQVGTVSYTYRPDVKLALQVLKTEAGTKYRLVDSWGSDSLNPSKWNTNYVCERSGDASTMFTSVYALAYFIEEMVDNEGEGCSFEYDPDFFDHYEDEINME